MPTKKEFQDVTGDTALAWVAEQNKKTVNEISAHPDFQQTVSRCFSVISSKEKIAWPSIQPNGSYYNFWRDSDNVRGVLRETDSASYRTQHPSWRVILDVDKLAHDEGCEWVYQGRTWDEFSGKIYSLIQLSDGGSDAHIMREFDVSKREFVQNGFYLPEAKSDVVWLDENTLLTSTDFGDGSLTESGYPRQARLLKRGQLLLEAEKLFEVDSAHLKMNIICHKTKLKKYLFFTDVIDFYSIDFYFVPYEDLRQRYRLPIPQDAILVAVFKNIGIVQLKSDWQLDESLQFKTNDVLQFDLEKFSSEPHTPAHELNFQLIYRPGSRCAVESITCNDHALFLTISNNVNGELIMLKPSENGFLQKKLPFIEQGEIRVTSLSLDSDEVFITCENFLTPSTLFSYNSREDTLEQVKMDRADFNADLYRITQHEVVSRDGTLVPYHMIARKDFVRDGTNPVLLYGYGGFEVSLTPSYLGLNGATLLEKGFVYVQANIRGGGEFGAEWAKSGRKENQQNSFDDFIAIAFDLINRRVTSPQFLGIEGGSNGGLLVGACAVQKPELFGAVLCEVPLLDMLEYHKLLAGDSWKEEYGDPENPEERSFIEKYSPLQNVKAGVSYPPMFIQTSTKDDRVHPYHARIMAQTLQELGNQVHYYEDETGGHSYGSDLKKIAVNCAIQFVYLYKQLLEPALAHRQRMQQNVAAQSSVVRLFSGLSPQIQERVEVSVSEEMQFQAARK